MRSQGNPPSGLRTDPLRTVYDALERRGCQPRGPVHKFRSRCPAHDSDSPSLSAREGVDGRAIVRCFRGCRTEAVIAALGLGWADLFPPGHHHARPLALVVRRPRRALDLVLEVLRELGIPYRCTRNPSVWVAERCPACLADDRFPLWIFEHDDDRSSPGRVELSCFSGCDQVTILDALVGEQSEEKAG